MIIENQIIEIKSKYFYDKEEENNILKAKASLKAGYKYEFWIFHKKKRRI